MRTVPDWYTITNIAAIDSPALVVYPERVKQNISTLISMVDDITRLRPHMKTNKCAEVALLFMDAGITRFKCATIAEAEMLGRCGAPDVLFAYQPLGPKLQRFICLVHKYPRTRYACLVDNQMAALQMAAAFAGQNLVVPVYIDLNIGMDRTGIAPDAGAMALYLAAHGMNGLRPIGLHAYDGHLRDPDLVRRTEDCNKAFEKVIALRDLLVNAGLTEPVIVAGGSPTFSIHARRKQVECSPGTFVYWDKGYIDMCAEQLFVPAALVLTRVISLPSPTKICVDLGHKAVASENELSRRVYFLNAPGLVPDGQNEEHLVLEAPEGHGYAPGDVLYGLPMHICPTVALYEDAHIVENHFVTGSWKNIARDRSIGC